MTFIDYSQYKTWMTCPWMWYERYVNNRIPRPSTRQRDDAMAIGSLVHSGLECWYRDGKPTISPDVVEEVGPTPEAFAQAEQMVHAYVRRYPREEWELVRCEEPLTVPLTTYAGEDIRLLAKIDAYFRCTGTVELESVVPGHSQSLEPGLWIQEYKTKDASRARDLWMRSWESNMQASFQILALQGNYPAEQVGGLLVSVLERTRPYIPKRKCKQCGELLEMGLYIATSEGHSCPLCGAVQKLSPYQPKKEATPPDFFRLRVTRGEDQLCTARAEIQQVARLMAQARANGMEVVIPNREECVGYRGTCGYFNNHTYGVPTVEDPMMLEKSGTRYVGLEVGV